VVGERSDRIGVRLEGTGAGAGVRGAGELASFPVVPGSVQLTPSGELVVLGPDAGVTGGYPVLGVVPRAGLDALAQARPGTAVGVRRRTRRGPGRSRGLEV
jgi:allophanate hydrolase subunit 2